MTVINCKAAVVGCGVSGLTCGIRLLEQDFSVTIFARDLPPHTTSNVAAAFWAPGALFSSDAARSLSLVSFHTFEQLAQNPDSGITFKRLIELFDEPVSAPRHLEPVGVIEPVQPGRFPPPYRGGYQLTVPAIDTPITMNFLVQQFQALGGLIEPATISDLSELTKQYPVVVNCTGVWAGQLVNDRLVYPIRGQVIRVRKPPDLKPEILHANTGSETTYIVPRSGDCILGGTYEDHNWNLQPDMATAEAIIERCAALNPAFRQPDIIEHKVGLRPGRWGLRLELEQVSGTSAIIHNYGHGSVGHTLSWGCAAEVVRLAVEFRGAT